MVAFFLSILAFVSKYLGMADKKKERTFLMIKPDAVQRGLVGEIITRFEKRGYTLVAMKFVQPTQQLLELHYAEHKGKCFFAGLVKHMASGPVVPMVWEGLDVIAQSRKVMGATKPQDSAPGTIRGDLAIDLGRNVIHGSDSVETAKREIDIWFNDKEVTPWLPSLVNWLYE